MDGGEEVALSLIVSCSDGTKLLELGEEIFDQMPRLEQFAVVVARRLAALSRRDHGGLAGCLQGLNDALFGVECLVGDQRVRLHLRQEMIGAHQIVRFAASQEDAGRVAKRIDGSVDLGAPSAARAADRLVLAGFFWAPALC